MDYNPGRKLLNTFEQLGINLGVCGPNVIEAWFDVDHQNNRFLNWLSKNLTEENVLYEYELAEYEDNVNKNLVINTDDKDLSIIRAGEKYPGIFDPVDTEFEIECLEDELNMLLEDKQQLDDILHLHSNLYKKENASLSELEAHYITTVNELEKSEEECLTMSHSLDKINIELFTSIASCSEKLQEYECSFGITYISNIPINKYYNQYKHIISYFTLLDKKEFAGLPKLQSAVKTCSKLDGSIFNEKNDDDLNCLKKKLFKSIQSKNYTEAIKEQLQSELQFLEQLNIHELLNSLTSKKEVEGNIQSKSDQYSLLSLELENLSVEISEKYITFPSISTAKQELQLLQGKLNHVNEVGSVFTSILSYHALLYFMLIINNADMQRSDQFFRSAHRYIGHNLTQCELRMDSMTDIIKQYKLYESTPFNQRNVLLQVLCRLLSGINVNKFDLDALNTFHQEIHSYSFNEDVEFRRKMRLIENNNRVLQSFLTNGPTAEIILIPFKLHTIFNEIETILNTRNNTITTTVAVWKDALKQTSETEWVKLKRQLWMYFLMQPQKVLTYIKKIEDEVRRMSAEAV